MNAAHNMTSHGLLTGGNKYKNMMNNVSSKCVSDVSNRFAEAEPHSLEQHFDVVGEHFSAEEE